MATLTLRARYPLGTFLGHRADGQPAPFPDTARLFSALVHAAAKGSTAVLAHGGDLGPSDSARAALRWLESHPPTAISLPERDRVSPSIVDAYRAEGVFESNVKPSERKVRKRQSGAVALAGPVGWAWDLDAPEEIVATLRLLSADVSCLGESDSPVVLEVDDRFEVTHRLDPDATGFADPSGQRVRTPVIGRLAELDSDHEILLRVSPAGRDKHSWSERPSSAAPSVGHLREMIYRPVAQVPVTAPWSTVVLVPIVGTANFRERVLWCVAMHRALASRLGDHAPALLTGRYGAGVPRPVNRLAIHLLSAGQGKAEHDSFALLIPPAAGSAELAELDRAMQRLSKIYAHGQEVQLETPTALEAGSFWEPPEPGHRRLWRPDPALVPEVRRQRGTAWTLADAACLSVAFVTRDQLPTPANGKQRYRSLVDSVRARGVTAYECRLVHDSNTRRYAHKLPDGLTATPFGARIDAGPLIPTTALWAAGQSRHLGGGMMVPDDRPESELVESESTT